jgi:hypothetical protein
MNGRLRAALIAGAVAAGLFQVLVRCASDPPPPLIEIIVYTAVGLSFLVAGIAAWQRWPASRLGLLFTIVGYVWALPSVGFMPYALPFTIGLVTATVYGAPLGHLALAWPTGRLRSRFERWVVIAVYTWDIGQGLGSTLFWNPSTNGCGPGCPANLLLVNGSNSIENAFDAWSVPVSLVINGIVLTLIVLHWRTARGWSRRTMIPLLWISIAVIALTVTQTLASNLNLPLSNFALYNVAPLILMTGPALFVASTLFARTARGAVGTAIVDLGPEAPPGTLRDALARALGDATLQLAFRLPDGSGYLDTAGQPVDPARPGRVPAGP